MKADPTRPDLQVKEARLSSILKRANRGERVAQHNVLAYILETVRAGNVPHASAIDILGEILRRAHKKRAWAHLRRVLRGEPLGTDREKMNLHRYLSQLYLELHTEKRARKLVSLHSHGKQRKETPDYLREAALEVQSLTGNNKIGNTIVSVARKFGLSRRTLERAYADLKRE